MNRLTVETNRARIVSRLAQEGWVLRHGGNHDVCTHPDRPRVVITVPRHRVVSTGVARVIARRAGWLEQER